MESTRQALQLDTPTSDRWTLTLVVRTGENEAELTRVAVSQTELSDLRSELWLELCLRKGHPDRTLDQTPIEIEPVLAGGVGPRCSGFVAQGESGPGEHWRREYGVDLLQDLACQVAQQKIQAERLKIKSYSFEVLARRDPLPDAEDARALRVTSREQPLAHLLTPLAPLLRTARQIGTCDERTMPVFYTEQALAKAELFSRRGAAAQPATETGAALIGPLCSCPQTGEFFVVVYDVLEATDAEQTLVSLAYSGKTWARLQVIVKARQAQPATRAVRILGQAHGHNFLPSGGAPPCELCAHAKVCGRSSVFVSVDDRTWSRAVFARQPWQLCQIFGLNARREPVQALFGLRDNRLQERGFYVIPAFEGLNG